MPVSEILCIILGSHLTENTRTNMSRKKFREEI
jgi:hypothetical protein